MGKFTWLEQAQGDLGLATLRAKECIESADVIVYDHLANPDMLGWARDDAEIIDAGSNPVKAARSRKSLRCSSTKRAKKAGGCFR